MSGTGDGRERGHLVDLLLFAATVTLAALERWSATDLVWSLWVSSLLVGYSFIFVYVVSGLVGKDLTALAQENSGSEGKAPRPATPLGAARMMALPPVAMMVFLAVFAFGLNAAGWLLLLIALVMGLPAMVPSLPRRLGLGFEFDPEHPLFRVVMLAPWAIFLLGFFTLHFVGFHFVHSIFLNGFFPLTGNEVFGTAPDETFLWFEALIYTAVSAYWPFLLFSVISSRREYLRAATETDAGVMFGPYKNVIRMHLLIFVFAGMHFAGLEGYVVYPVLFFYFFPLRAVGTLFRRSPAPA